MSKLLEYTEIAAIIKPIVDRTPDKRDAAHYSADAVQRAVLAAQPDYAGALAALLKSTDDYVDAARQHYEASFMDDESEMEKANKQAEKVYKHLNKARDDARDLVGQHSLFKPKAQKRG